MRRTGRDEGHHDPRWAGWKCESSIMSIPFRSCVAGPLRRLPSAKEAKNIQLLTGIEWPATLASIDCVMRHQWIPASGWWEGVDQEQIVGWMERGAWSMKTGDVSQLCSWRLPRTETIRREDLVAANDRESRSNRPVTYGQSLYNAMIPLVAHCEMPWRCKHIRQPGFIGQRHEKVFRKCDRLLDRP